VKFTTGQVSATYCFLVRWGTHTGIEPIRREDVRRRRKVGVQVEELRDQQKRGKKQHVVNVSIVSGVIADDSL
jgi:hypothetical protein